MRGSNDTTYDQVDLALGQREQFGEKVNFRYFGGVRVASLNMKDRGKFSALALSQLNELIRATAETKIYSNFGGMGPRGGVDVKVHFWKEIYFTGTCAGSILAGDLNQRYDAFNQVENLDQGTTLRIEDKFRTGENIRVVPELDMKISVNVTHHFTDETALQFELGFQSINYFDPKHNGAVSYSTSQQTTNDFGLEGIYVKVQLDIA